MQPRAPFPKASGLPGIVIIGGGIAGLYAAFLLGRAGYPVTLLEQSDRWGGRIESEKLPSESADPFIAEFGPMRFEPGLQERLTALAHHLGIQFAPFAPTTAPACPTDYELSDVEASFASASDLLMWSVLRMFFGGPAPDQLAAVPGGEEMAVGPRELEALRAILDGHFDTGYPAVQSFLDSLREGARLGGSPDPGVPLLRDLGLWNALTEILTPGALAKIRDSGTFYHFIPHNPSAAEWGIFWLRQASTRGRSIETFDPRYAPNGVRTLVERLRERIEAECPSVNLRLQQKAVGIEQGSLPHELEVWVADQRDDVGDYSLHAGHVVLALPQTPLKKLSAAFPEDVVRSLDQVLPLPLLKAFLVTTRPWWGHHLNAQSHAWLVPTRELHYYALPEDPACERSKQIREGRAPTAACACPPVETGMVMLYTDVPAIDFWRPFVLDAEQPSAHIYGRSQEGIDAENELLKKALVRQLLIEAHPDVATKIEIEKHRLAEALRQKFGDMGERLFRKSQDGASLAAVLRDQVRVASADERELFEEMFGDLFGQDGNWVQGLLTDEAPRRSKEDLTADYMSSILAYGIHDWSREPFGGAAHVWRPGARSFEIRERLAGFGLRGAAGADNLHICGEAYSDFQGFIEGALHSAEQVCLKIAGPGFAISMSVQP